MASAVVFILSCGLLVVSGKDLRAHFDDDGGTTCGYSSCNAVKDDMINVHIVPHTHDDVGWLLTVDQYYYEEVQYILDSVIPELLNDPSKRFIYVEIAFFDRWYREQHDSMRHAVKRLVNEGRLEFILGGWCMNDEAATHYNAIIDQHTLGFEFLRENFGKCGKPRVGWQIDPFGHSREQASIFARFGFDSLFFGRLDYQDKATRENHTTMEMIWRGSPDNLGTVADLFTGVLQNGYGPPPGFCFDIFCHDTSIVDDTRLHDVNVKERVDAFLVEMSSQAKHYGTNHLITTMGSDFNYQAAHNWFKNLDKLIKYVNARKVFNDAVKKLEGQSGTERYFCTLLNISVCPYSESEKEFKVTIYNPVARPGLSYVRIPVSSTSDMQYSVTGPDGSKVTSEKKVPFVGGYDVVLQNEYISVAFDGKTGKLKNMTNLEKKISIDLTQSFAYYLGKAGNNSEPQFQASGAYVFRPNETAPLAVGLGQARLTVKAYFVKGELVQEVYQEFSSWITQTVKLYGQQRFVEFQWTVGPIPVQDGEGKEVVSLFQTNLSNNKTFYTDANGREILKRRLNHRDTWVFNNTEPVAGNYYPVNSRIYIKDEAKKVQFTVLTDRSQGGSSLQDGGVQLMVHRRLLYDDSLGVGEALNETGSDGKGLIARGSHYVMLEPIASAAAGHRDLAERLFMAPQIAFSQPSGKLPMDAKNMWSGVHQALPDNVHLLTLEQYPSFGPVPSLTQPFLLRLEHFYEKGEDAVLSQPVTVNLQKMFTSFDIIRATELTLGGDMALTELNRLKWNYPHEDQDTTLKHRSDTVLKFEPERQDMSSVSDPLSVTLNPMEIKTFQITIKPATQQN